MKTTFTEIELGGEVFWLLPQKAMFRPRKKQLILSDVHLGKTTHFRKQGLPLPIQGQLMDLDRLEFLVRQWKPSSVLVLGDLFHSDYNEEWLWFSSFIQGFAQVEFILVQGNHDILDAEQYAHSNLTVHPEIEEKRFVFSHKPLQSRKVLNICGHVHPGIRIEGKAKQSITLPCFYLNSTHFILPAFGYLTGLHLLKQEEQSAYFLVLADRVVKL